MDVSSRVADVLDFKRMGTARVKVEYVGAAPLEGSDDNELLATLRTDGSPASLKGSGSPSFWPIMVASQQSPPPPPVHLIAPTAPAPPRRPEPEPAVATVEPSRVLLAHPPVPPARPFDLGAAHASFAVASATAPLPPRSPVRLSSGDRALDFATPSSPWLHAAIPSPAF